MYIFYFQWLAHLSGSNIVSIPQQFLGEQKDSGSSEKKIFYVKQLQNNVDAKCFFKEYGMKL